MLTSDDLQAIGDLIDQKLDKKLDEKLGKELEPLKKGYRRLQRDISFIKKTLNMVIGHFDEVDANHRKRIEALEDYAGLLKKN